MEGRAHREQIRENIVKQLTGSEPGLVGLWNFDDPANPGRDASPNHHDGKLMGNARAVAVAGATATQSVASSALDLGEGNRVLTLGDTTSYVQLPSRILDGLSALTIEGWARWDTGEPWAGFIRFGAAPGVNHKLTVHTEESVPDTIHLVIDHRTPDGAWEGAYIQATGVRRVGEWIHVAAVFDENGARFYTNGVLAGSNRKLKLSLLKANTENTLGDAWRFVGSMDEIRLWKVARDEKQIRDNILARLTGNEEGLLALWNFDDPANPGHDASPNHHDGKLAGNARAAVPSVAIAGTMQSPVPFAGASNRTLQLDGIGSYVELPADAFKDLEQATIEGWVNMSASGFWSRILDFGAPISRIWVGQAERGQTLRFNIGDDTGSLDGTLLERTLVAKDSLVPGKWVHFACVTGPGGIKLYVDGVLVDSKSLAGSFAGHRVTGRYLLGRSTNKDGGDPNYLSGQLDEVRVWNVERTADQIRENILKQLTGNEPGLVGLWNFDDPANPGRDASPNHHDGMLGGNARVGPGDLFAKSSAPQTVGVNPGQKGILDLDGNGSYVALPAGMFKDLEEATVEGWVLWRRFGFWSRFFDFGEPNYDINVTIQNRGPKIGLELPPGNSLIAGSDKALELNRWVHLAAVLGRSHARLYVDGELVVSYSTTVSFEAFGNSSQYLLGGHMPWRGKGPANPITETDGSMEEVRVWNIARTPEQIRDNILKQLTGNEPGLVGLWNFDDLANPGRDASPNHHDGKLIGNARAVPAAGGDNAPAGSREKVFTVTISSTLTDRTGKALPGAEVQLLQGARKIASAKSGTDGNYFLITTANERPYRLTASFGQLEAVSAEAPLKPGPNKIDLQLRDTLRISGTLSDSDGQPRRGVKVEAVNSAGVVAAMTVSDASGKFVIRRLADGDYTLRAPGVGGPVVLENGRVFSIAASQPVTDLVLRVPAAPQAVVRNSDRANRVLSLNPEGGYVRLPPNIFNELNAATIEGWVLWSRLTDNFTFYDYGRRAQNLNIKCFNDGPDLQANLHATTGVRSGLAPGVLRASEWCHVALVTGKGGMKLYFNGTMVSSKPFSESFSALGNGEQHFLGKDVWRSGSAGNMEGRMDEVRVWVTERTGDEIRATMFQRLSGREEGLAALWNFDDPDNPGRDATPNGFDGEMVKNAAAQPESLPAAAAEIAQWASLSGVAVDVDGRPLGKVKVRVERGEEHLDAESDLVGNFSLLVRASARTVARDGHAGRSFRDARERRARRGRPRAQFDFARCRAALRSPAGARWQPAAHGRRAGAAGHRGKWTSPDSRVWRRRSLTLKS